MINLKNVTFVIFFLDKNFSYEPYLWNRCHDFMRKAINFNDVAIVSNKRNDYRIHFRYMSKDEAISIMHNSNINEKTGLLKKKFSLYIKDERNNLLSKKQSKRLL